MFLFKRGNALIFVEKRLYLLRDILQTNTYEICEICFWEDDGYQYKYPDETGANYVSFRKAQQNFLKFWAKGERSLQFGRSPNKSDIKDHNWKPL